jgi:hypothetical protein
MRLKCGGVSLAPQMEMQSICDLAEPYEVDMLPWAEGMGREKVLDRKVIDLPIGK